MHPAFAYGSPLDTILRLKCKTTAKIKAVTTHPNNQSSSAKKVASTSPASSSNFLVSAEDSFYRNDAIPGKKRPRSCDGVLQEGHCRRPFRGGIDAGGELAPTVRQALCLVQV